MWIRVDVAAPDGRKARRLQRAIELANVPPVPAHDPRVVLGTLAMLWIRTRVQAPHGFFDGHAPEDIAALVGCTDAEARALLEIGWLDLTDAGLEVHQWMEHNGDHLLEAKRKRDARAADRARRAIESGAPAPAVDRPVLSRPVTSRGRPAPDPDVRRTSTGRDEGPPGPESGPVAPSGSSHDAHGARGAIFAAGGVHDGEAEAFEAYAGLQATDDSPEANARRAAFARMDVPARAAMLEPVAEANRQRVLVLLSLTGRREPGPDSIGDAADLATETRAPAPGEPRLNVARIAEIAAGLGKTRQALAIRLAQWLHNRGVTHAGLLERFIHHFAAHADAIRSPFAYFNPGREGFEIIRQRCAAEAATDEHEALKAAEIRWLAGAGGTT